MGWGGGAFQEKVLWLPGTKRKVDVGSLGGVIAIVQGKDKLSQTNEVAAETEVDKFPNILG